MSKESVTLTFSSPTAPRPPVVWDQLLGQYWNYFCRRLQRPSHCQFQWVFDSGKIFLDLCSLNTRGTPSFWSALPLDSTRPHLPAYPYSSFSRAPLPLAAPSMSCPPPYCSACPPWMISPPTRPRPPTAVPPQVPILPALGYCSVQLTGFSAPLWPSYSPHPMVARVMFLKYKPNHVISLL